MVARRSTRVFENDIDVRQIEDSVLDGGIGYIRKGDEKSQERDITRLTDMMVHTRTSSMSSLTAPVDGEIITTFQRVSRSDSEEVFGSVKGEVVENPNPKMYGRPRNFGTILPGIYRSGYPESEDYEFLRDLSLRTIVTLVDKDYPEGYQTFMQSNGINHVVIKMEGTKKVDIPQSVMNSILEVVMDRQNHPLLLHCNQGRHRTGCAVAVIRKVLGWSVESTLNEYTSFAHPKVRQVDVNYIRQFEVATLVGIVDPKITRTASFSKPRPFSRSHKTFRFAVFTIFIFILCTLTVFRYRIA
ncbi:tyrosine-protein phosphatase siw14 [Pseudogymnoascus australis]